MLKARTNAKQLKSWARAVMGQAMIVKNKAKYRATSVAGGSSDGEGRSKVTGAFWQER